MGKKRPKINLQAAHDIHGLLDFMLAECAWHNKSDAKRMTLPYHAVLGHNKKFAGANLVIEISIKWDAGSKHDRANDESTEPIGASATKTRH